MDFAPVDMPKIFTSAPAGANEWYAELQKQVFSGSPGQDEKTVIASVINRRLSTNPQYGCDLIL